MNDQHLRLKFELECNAHSLSMWVIKVIGLRVQKYNYFIDFFKHICFEVSLGYKLENVVLFK